MATIHSISARQNLDDGKASDLLKRMLAEDDETKAEILLGDLVSTHLEPLMLRIVSSRLRRHNPVHRSHAEDVTSEAVVSFLLHVEELRRGRVEAITNLESFAALLAARACNDYFRRSFPAFHGLRNKLRYLLERYPDLARWQDEGSGEWICGLAEWSKRGIGGRKVVTDIERLTGLEGTKSAKHPADQLALIFRKIDAPIRFNDLALVMARLWNVRDNTSESEDDPEPVDANCPVDITLGRKQWLQNLWQQICQLSRNQKTALLLNLKGPDGGCGASLLVTTGAATLRQIAQAVEIPEAEFAALWRRLPLSDLEVADLLSLSRQQVINLRKCARAKLTQKMNPAKRFNW
jgi:hypothetical protein